MCGTRCAECPRQLHQPQTAEGADVWALASDVGGQWRHALISGPGGAVSVPSGYDMTAVIAMARERGLDTRAVAELMPVIEYAAQSSDRETGND
ncbi:DUF7697 family protein [Roseovarius indicus]|uniref:DUF7697 family protein n=1 Tax=Roseovarius indicus TaxID=540747 RepID=UPI0009EF05F9